MASNCFKGAHASVFGIFHSVVLLSFLPCCVDVILPIDTRITLDRTVPSIFRQMIPM